MLERVKRATRHYEKLYSNVSLEKQKIPSILYIFLIKLLKIVDLLKINFLVKSYLSKYSTDNRDCIVVVNTYNQLNVYKKLFKSEEFIFSVSTIIQSSEVDSQFTKTKLFLYILANPKESIEILNGLINDWYYKDNQLRLLRLTANEFLFRDLLKNRTKLIHFNDHHPISVHIHDLAKSFEMKTIYIQHAPVSKLFPRLYHDLNILFSQDSLKKYNYSEDSKKIKSFLLFDPRFTINKNTLPVEKNQILIAYNEIDNLISIKQLIDQLISLRLGIILRPHPADKRSTNELTDYENVGRSQHADPWFDLSMSKYVICNESAIILEAIYLNKLTYKYFGMSKSIDNYEFIKQGLITQEFGKPEALIKAIKEKKICYDKSKISYFIGNHDKHKIEGLKDEISNL